MRLIEFTKANGEPIFINPELVTVIESYEETKERTVTHIKTTTMSTTVVEPLSEVIATIRGTGFIPHEVVIDYLNHLGHRSKRRIEPIELWFGVTDYHKEPQWLLKAFCFERQSKRDFAMKDIMQWKEPED